MIRGLLAAATLLLAGCAAPSTRVEVEVPAALLRPGLEGTVRAVYETRWFGRDILVRHGDVEVHVTSDPTAAAEARGVDQARLLEALRLALTAVPAGG